MVFISICTWELSGECLKYLNFILDQLNQNFWGQGLALLKSSWVFPVFFGFGLSSPENRLYDRDVYIGSLLRSTLCNNMYKTEQKRIGRSLTSVVVTEVSANATGRSGAGIVFYICLKLRQSNWIPLNLYIHPNLDFSCLWRLNGASWIKAFFHWMEFPGVT